MTDSIVQQVQDWFAENERTLSEMFPKVRCHIMEETDPVRGKATIQVDGKILGGSITFWNKRDVEAMALDKVSGQNHLFDDRVLGADDDVTTLLQGYLERLTGLLKADSR